MSGAPRPGALPAEIQRAISREDVIALPIRRWEGATHVIASPAEVDAALADIRAERVVGFDTETRPAFRKGEHHLPSLAQVATARAVHLFQLRRTDCSAALAELLGAAGIVKAGVALAHDLRELKQLFAFEERAVFDAGLVARRHGLKQSGVRNLRDLPRPAHSEGREDHQLGRGAPLARADRLRGDRRLGVPRAVPALRGAGAEIA